MACIVVPITDHKLHHYCCYQNIIVATDGIDANIISSGSVTTPETVSFLEDKIGPESILHVEYIRSFQSNDPYTSKIIIDLEQLNVKTWTTAMKFMPAEYAYDNANQIQCYLINEKYKDEALEFKLRFG